tara:strand:- start:9588 stop:10442 length:855 start_codon:yes stop_codon:yes gene_type:complete
MILLTGNKGFIGSHFEQFLADKYPLFCCDLLDNFDLCEASKTKKLPDCQMILHLAALNGTRFFYEKPMEVANNNTLPTINLLNRYKHSNSKFIFASTCEIFNSTVDFGIYQIPTDENVPIMFTDITNPRWSYSLPKALGENMVANSGMDWLIIRYFNIYGPGQKHHFIQEFVERVKTGEYYINGDDTRSFCYVTDAVELSYRISKNVSNEIINVGNDEEVHIKHVAQEIMDLMGVDPNLLEVRESPTGSAKRRCPDLTKLRCYVPDYNYTSLKSGLKMTLESLI